MQHQLIVLIKYLQIKILLIYYIIKKLKKYTITDYFPCSKNKR